MSATMISENKYVHELIEDELSTSAEGSDNDIAVTSGDEEPPSPTTSGFIASAAKPRRGLVAEMVRLPAATLLDLCTFLTALFLATLAQAQQQVLIAQAATSVRQTPRKAVKASKAPQGRSAPLRPAAVLPPPGLSLPAAGFVAPPPGLSLPPCHQVKERQLSIDKVGPPPGLGARQMSIDEVGPPPGLGAISCPPGLEVFSCPPGLEAFAGPPGLFFPQARLPAAPARNSRKKQPKPTVVAPEPREKRGRKQAPPVGAAKVPAKAPRAEAQAPAPAPIRPATPPPEPREFDLATYRKELSDVLRDLANGSTVSASVARIRAQNVPKEKQAEEFSDIVTRAAEENRGVARRLAFAFAAGLAANNAFGRDECETGLLYFFGEVFDDLAAEVPRLRNKLANEFAPTLRTVFSEEDMARLVPLDCRPVLR